MLDRETLAGCRRFGACGDEQLQHGMADRLRVARVDQDAVALIGGDHQPDAKILGIHGKAVHRQAQIGFHGLRPHAACALSALLASSSADSSCWKVGALADGVMRRAISTATCVGRPWA